MRQPEVYAGSLANSAKITNFAAGKKYNAA